MECPMCGAAQGDIRTIADRGFTCTACGRVSRSDWWARAQLDSEPLVDRLTSFTGLTKTAGDAASVTYRATTASRTVELRVFRPWVADNRDFVNTFTRLVSFHHPLAREATAGCEGGVYFVAGEPMTRSTLAAMRGGRLPLAGATDAIRALADLLAAVHDAGLVIALAPDRIGIVRHEGDLAIGTVDVAWLALDRGWYVPTAETEYTAYGIHTKRIIDYLSPEQLMGMPLDARSHVYTLGVVAYELVTGRVPFPDATGPAGLVTAQLKRTPASPRDLAPELAAETSDAILRALAKDKTARFADPSAFADALGAYGYN